GIDHASAELDEAPQHVALRPALPRIADVERLPGAETDGGDGLAAGRNRARERHWAFRRVSSYGGNACIGVGFIAAAPARGPVPMGPRGAQMGGNMPRSMVSGGTALNTPSRWGGPRSRDCGRNISSMSGSPPYA